MEKHVYELISLLKSGDQSVIEEFYQIIYPKIYAIALRVVKTEADAKDITQDSILTIYSHIHQLQDIDKFYGWAKMIVVSKATALFRKKKPVALSPELISMMNREEHRFYMDPKAMSDIENKKRIMYQMLSKLSKKHAEVLTLLYLEQVSLEEAAMRLNVPVGTVKSRSVYAKKELLKIMKAYEKEHDYSFMFQANTVLASIFAFPWIKKWKEKINPKTLLNVGACSTMVVASISLGSDINYLQPNSSSRDVIYADDSFPTIQYKDKIVQSSKSAFYTCLEFAYTEKDMEHKNQEEVQEILPIVKALHVQQNPYTKELQNRGWYTWFQKKVQNF